MKQRFAALKAQFNWRIILVRWLVYALVLLFVALLVPNIYFIDRSISVWLIVAGVFGLLNAVIRPLLHALMLQLFFVSLGLVVALINGLMLFLLSRIFPQYFAVDSILWALVGGILVALFGSFLEGLFGLTRPIVPESEEELRSRLKAQDRSLMYTFIKTRPVPLANEDMPLQVQSPMPDDAAAPPEMKSEPVHPPEAPAEIEPEAAAGAPSDHEEEEGQ